MTSVFSRVISDDGWPWQKIVRDELKDDPELHQQQLQQFRDKILCHCRKHKDFKPILDEDFLLAFMRTRGKSDVEKAFKAYERYFAIRLYDPTNLMPVGKGTLDFIRMIQKNLTVPTKKRNPIDGTCILIWAVKNFDSSVDSVAAMLTMTMMIGMDVSVKDVAFQALGNRMIFDFSGQSLSFVGTCLKRMSDLKALLKSQGSFPFRYKGFHVINDPYGLGKTLYSFMRPFMPTKMQKRVHFHGHNLADLHEYISPLCLPTELGGTEGPLDGTWAIPLLEQIHEETVKQSYYGYV